MCAEVRHSCIWHTHMHTVQAKMQITACGLESSKLQDLPPGMTRPSHLLSCSFVRTSKAVTPGILLRQVQCSRNDPCSASTPTFVSAPVLMPDLEDVSRVPTQLSGSLRTSSPFPEHRCPPVLLQQILREASCWSTCKRCWPCCARGKEPLSGWAHADVLALSQSLDQVQLGATGARRSDQPDIRWTACLTRPHAVKSPGLTSQEGPRRRPSLEKAGTLLLVSSRFLSSQLLRRLLQRPFR